ncbi:MAG: hypothetical protein F6K23_20040 [Okeania sp. SIO2C9]|uniref:hypothetical protein n=1 Tax=Okeania sp. SIO2C9 TaxID=2607791 RepID=UPI0013C0F818|nr:hypothetical protein [Okeania sp. SIO2C9]NEQ75131.1 hypothetical protein [Okeania sp. SIO2C9]
MIFFPTQGEYPAYFFGASQNELLVCDGSDRSVSLFIKVSMGEIFSFGASQNDFWLLMLLLAYAFESLYMLTSKMLFLR